MASGECTACYLGPSRTQTSGRRSSEVVLSVIWQLQSAWYWVCVRVCLCSLFRIHHSLCCLAPSFEISLQQQQIHPGQVNEAHHRDWSCGSCSCAPRAHSCSRSLYRDVSHCCVSFLKSNYSVIADTLLGFMPYRNCALSTFLTIVMCAERHIQLFKLSAGIPELPACS